MINGPLVEIDKRGSKRTRIYHKPTSPNSRRNPSAGVGSVGMVLNGCKWL